jgi:hypothetical protein
VAGVLQVNFILYRATPTMSALGQKQTFCDAEAMSALPRKADICSALAHVRFVPIADIVEMSALCRTRCEMEYGTHWRANTFFDWRPATSY